MTAMGAPENPERLRSGALRSHPRRGTPMLVEWMIVVAAIALSILIGALVVLELRDWLRARRRKP